MKKSKFLIPALSIASVGAVVAPMVTSCAKSNGISFDIFTKDGWQEYTTKYKALKASEVTFKGNDVEEAQLEAILAYGREVEKHPDILADDFINYIDLYCEMMPDVPSSLTMSVKDISVNYATMEGDTQPLFNYTSSVKFVDEDEEYTSTITVKCHNMPFMMRLASGSSYAQIGMLLGPSMVPQLPDDPTEEEMQQWLIYFIQAELDYNAIQALIRSSIEVSYFVKEADGSVNTDMTCKVENFSDLAVLAAFVADDDYLPLFFYPVYTNYFQEATFEGK